MEIVKGPETHPYPYTIVVGCKHCKGVMRLYEDELPGIEIKFHNYGSGFYVYCKCMFCETINAIIDGDFPWDVRDRITEEFYHGSKLESKI